MKQSTIDPRLALLLDRLTIVRHVEDEYVARCTGDGCPGELYVGVDGFTCLSCGLRGSLESLLAILDVRDSRRPPRVPTWPAPLDRVAYHGLAGGFCRLVEAHTEADPVALLVQFLVAYGSAIGRGAHAVAERDRHGTNEYIALVGETAKGRKGSSIGHVRRRMASVDPAWEASHILGGLSSGEGLIHALRDPTYADDEGTPRLVDPGIGDKRLLVIEPELASVLAVLGRQGNTLSMVLRDAWDGRDLQVATKNSPGRSTAPHVSLIGHVTRDELLARMSGTESSNGFANRFLWLAVRRARELPEGGSLDDQTFVAFDRELAASVEYGRQAGRLDREADARKLWREAYHGLSEGQPGVVGAVTARAEAHVLRLSVLYAALDRSEVVRRDHLEAALALWRYAEDSARWIFGSSLDNADAERILRALSDAADGMSRTDISAIFDRNAPVERIDRALETLADRRLAHVQRVVTSGRPREVWYAV